VLWRQQQYGFENNCGNIELIAFDLQHSSAQQKHDRRTHVASLR